MSLTTALAVHRVDFPADDLTEPIDDQAANAAAVRQFTLHRLMAYGVEAGDALRLLELAGQGRSWQRSALAMADEVAGRLDDPHFPPTPIAAADLQLRASALLRISQVLELDNTPQRRAVYARAVASYDAARGTDARFEKVEIATCNGPVNAWVITPAGEGPFPVVLVHGGVDGWCMDWEGLALPLVEEGMVAVVIDGPGQGETRFTHDHFLTPTWLDAYEQVCDFLVERAAGQPVAAVGNSMAAGLVMLIASRYPVFAAVCSNGPVTSMAAQLARRSYARKLASFCRPDASHDEVLATFEAMELSADRLSLTSPFLLLQGDEDPMVPVSHGDRLLADVPAEDKRMVLFAGGEHVINRYPADKHHVIRTWIRDRINAAAL